MYVKLSGTESWTPANVMARSGGLRFSGGEESPFSDKPVSVLIKRYFQTGFSHREVVHWQRRQAFA